MSYVESQLRWINSGGYRHGSKPTSTGSSSYSSSVTSSSGRGGYSSSDRLGRLGGASSISSRYSSTTSSGGPSSRYGGSSSGYGRYAPTSSGSGISGLSSSLSNLGLGSGSRSSTDGGYSSYSSHTYNSGSRTGGTTGRASSRFDSSGLSSYRPSSSGVISSALGRTSSRGGTGTSSSSTSSSGLTTSNVGRSSRSTAGETSELTRGRGNARGRVRWVDEVTTTSISSRGETDRSTEEETASTRRRSRRGQEETEASEPKPDTQPEEDKDKLESSNKEGEAVEPVPSTTGRKQTAPCNVQRWNHTNRTSIHNIVLVDKTASNSRPKPRESHHIRLRLRGKEEEEEKDFPPAKIGNLDLLIAENTKEHHTNKYEICQEGYIDDLTQEKSPAQLVARRGQPIKFKLTLDRQLDDNDALRITCKTGPAPLRSKGTMYTIITGKAPENDDDWTAKVEQSSGEDVLVSITTNAHSFVGRWEIEFFTTTADSTGNERVTRSRSADGHFYLLFNPWCKDDAVYMEGDDEREEYVLNDTGKVYVGNYRQIFGKPWNFGQFESVVIQCLFYLLDEKSDMADTSRGNIIAVCRKISALVNSADDYGILTGRWDGEYSDGISPTHWTGSVAILQKYMETLKPVRYGQCWVFSAVTTTICRALGIPARSVTNFASAHDTDGSLTIDSHWDEEGKPMPELDTDSIWNFHVWNEVWMSRGDLKSGYGGWQVIDATPQETSDGIYCAGPASVVAVKHGDVSTNYDTPFIFAEVNADKVHWYKQKDGTVKKILQRDIVGKNISTKAIGTSRDFAIGGYTPDREDLTLQYKFPEGSDAERAAVWNAARTSTKPHIYKDDNNIEDVEFKAVDLDDVFVGSKFELPIEVINNSDSARTVHLTVTLSSVYYTGVTRKQLKTQKYDKKLGPKSRIKFTMDVSPKEYLGDLVDHSYAMKINYLGIVKETKQAYASQDDFRLRTIIPDVTTSKQRVKVGEKFIVKVKFTNPLDKPLAGCVFTYEAAGNLKPTQVGVKDVPVGGVVESECEIEAKRSGNCVVITAFESKELGDIQGQINVAVDK